MVDSPKETKNDTDNDQEKHGDDSAAVPERVSETKSLVKKDMARDVETVIVTPSVVSDQTIEEVGAANSHYNRRVGDQPAKKFRISLKPSFVMLTLIVSLASSAAIHFPWMFTATSNVKELVEKLNHEIVSDISSEVREIFSEAERAQNIIAESITSGAIDVSNKQKLLDYFFPILKNNEDFSWVSFGVPDGNFFGVNRINETHFQTVKSYWDQDVQLAQRINTKFVLQDGALFKTQTNAEQRKYDARERPWYKGAIALEPKVTDSIWTNVYIFSTSRSPGINSARRVDGVNSPLGVVSVAIELENLSSYLKNKFKDKPGTAAIIRGDGSLVAFEDSNEVVHQGGSGSKMQLRPLMDSYHPFLHVASQTITNNKVDLAAIDGHLHYETKDETGKLFYVNFSPVGHQDWSIVTIAPEDAFLSAIHENNQKLVITVSIALVLVAIMAILVARHFILRPIARMIKQAEAIERFELEKVRPVPSTVLELDNLSTAFCQMSRSLGSFRKYLPAELVQILVKNDQLAQVGGVNRTMTIYFSDLEGFTTLSEMLGPALLPHLSEYLQQMSGEIHEEKGIIDKFIGDAIMAFWGAPHVNDNQALDACRAALRCMALLSEMEAKNEAAGLPVFKARIGLNTGRVIVGNIGSDSRMDYTVLGDPVNLAARLEALNKNYGTRILIGATTYEFAKYEVIARKVDTVNVKGKDQKTPIYELLTMRSQPGAVMPGYEWVAKYEEALDRFENKDFEKAVALFEETIAMRGEDSPSRVMLARCREALGKAIV